MAIFDTPLILVLTLLITLGAGIVKGAIGFAMPLIMVSLIGSIVEPKLALAGIVIPIVFSNLYQSFRTGYKEASTVVQVHWRYIIITCLFIFLSAQLVPSIPNKMFYLVLGVPVLLLTIIQLMGVNMHIKPVHQNASEWIVGTISGMLGGLAGTWGPTTVLYLLAINTPKARQVVVQGVIYGLGAITLLFGHIKSGILNTDTVVFSFILLFPALLGMWLGFKIQSLLSQAQFRKITLIVLLIAGCNLIRLGLVY
ncbi:MAG: sulfite exporter TauE/SafE family protein [Glaciecola sp.]